MVINKDFKAIIHINKDSKIFILLNKILINNKNRWYLDKILLFNNSHNSKIKDSFSINSNKNLIKKKILNKTKINDKAKNYL